MWSDCRTRCGCRRNSDLSHPNEIIEVKDVDKPCKDEFLEAFDRNSITKALGSDCGRKEGKGIQSEKGLADIDNNENAEITNLTDDVGDLEEHLAPPVISQLSRASKGSKGTKFTPLEEDTPIFDLDAQRLEAASKHLPSYRTRVVAEVLAESLHQKAAHESARRFCSDATLLRYLCAADCDEKKALSMLKSTLEWRQKYFEGPCASSASGCPKCQANPRSHCFLHMGKDAAGRHVIYSCAGRATNKAVGDGMRHMAGELERIFEGNSAAGQVVWIVDFSGFGFADCNPKMGATAVPMFARHYPERFGQIVLFGMPSFFRMIYATTIKILDPVMQRKVVILQSSEARRRYADAYWRCNPSMAAWLDAVNNCACVPGIYPKISLGLGLSDPATRDILKRCAADAALGVKT